MPAILSLIVLILVMYCFWLFVRTANPYQMGRLLGGVALAIGACGLILLVFTGRLPLALLILIILWPFMAWYFDRRRKMILLQHHQPDQDGSKKEQVKNDFDQNS